MNKEIDITNVVIKTKRLELRAFRQDDLNDLYEYASVPGVGEAAGWRHHESIEKSQEILDMFIEKKCEFAIRLNGKTIGSLGVETYSEDVYKDYNHLLGREIGYVLSKDYWGQGIATEAVKAVIDYLFNVEKLDFIACRHNVENIASSRVQDKAGFIPFSENEEVNRFENKFLCVNRILLNDNKKH